MPLCVSVVPSKPFAELTSNLRCVPGSPLTLTGSSSNVEPFASGPDGIDIVIAFPLSTGVSNGRPDEYSEGSAMFNDDGSEPVAFTSSAVVLPLAVAAPNSARLVLQFAGVVIVELASWI